MVEDGSPFYHHMITMTSQAAKKIEDTADQLIGEVKRSYSVNKQLSDDLLNTLSFFFQSPLLPALELIEKSSVYHVTSPSGRSLYQVIGASGTPYTCFPGLKYCSCPAYQFSVLRKDTHMLCKHVLALRLAEAMDKLKPLSVSDTEIASMITDID
ncbi:hypothetical protein RRG08_012444 [Elysia crispata]|uniref:SWIM-type domain-containing protein n=1 Tax=Elysia crispata TaxID=231223 RepID=A0AAE1A1Y3_9GAST|nr:hypothetical protein RRG08_012444 [Elysia crispata]